MRTIFGLLLCVVFLQSQVYALSGGPDYDGQGGNASILGTYGGVIVEQCDCDGTNVGGSVGVFTINIARSGTSTGTTTIFSSGRVYPGTITGIGDSTSDQGSTFKAIIEASFTYTLSSFVTTTDTDGETTTTVVESQVTATTNGILDTTVDSFRVGAASNTLMTGTATLQLSNGEIDDDGNLVVIREIVYDVSGYRQALPTS